MAKKRLKQVRILHPELFELGKQAILKFESDMAEIGLKKSEKLSDSKIVSIMMKTCLSQWGVGDDLYLCSSKNLREETVDIVTKMVDSNTQSMLVTLSDWLGLSIVYRREGRRFYFSFKQADGSEKTLEIEGGKIVPLESHRIRVH